MPAEEQYQDILMELHDMPADLHHLTISVCAIGMLEQKMGRLR